MNYNKELLSNELDKIYEYANAKEKSDIDKNDFKKNIAEIIAYINKNDISFNYYWNKYFTRFIYEQSLSKNYEEIMNLNLFKINKKNFKIDKEIYELFYSLHRHVDFLNLIDKKQFFELLEALEALKSFNLKITELKKWSKWLVDVFDSEILSEYGKYIEHPIIYFLVVIKDILLPLNKKNIQSKNIYYDKLEKQQNYFQNTFLKSENDFTKKLKNVQKYDEIEKEKIILKDEDKDLKPILDLAIEYKISFLRLFQFLSFPFYIEELKNIPQDILLTHKDNLIVYSSKFYWGFSINASEYFYRHIMKKNRIIPYVYMYIYSNNFSDYQYIKFKKIINALIITYNIEDYSLIKLIQKNTNGNENINIELNDLKFITNIEIFDKINLELKNEKNNTTNIN